MKCKFFIFHLCQTNDKIINDWSGENLLIESLMWGANTNHSILTKMFGLQIFVNIIVIQYWHILCIYASLYQIGLRFHNKLAFQGILCLSISIDGHQWHSIHHPKNLILGFFRWDDLTQVGCFTCGKVFFFFFFPTCPHLLFFQKFLLPLSFTYLSPSYLCIAPTPFSISHVYHC